MQKYFWSIFSDNEKEGKDRSVEDQEFRGSLRRKYIENEK